MTNGEARKPSEKATLFRKSGSFRLKSTFNSSFTKELGILEEEYVFVELAPSDVPFVCFRVHRNPGSPLSSQWVNHVTA
jgi:hypothetical protein